MPAASIRDVGHRFQSCSHFDQPTTIWLSDYGDHQWSGESPTRWWLREAQLFT